MFFGTDPVGDVRDELGEIVSGVPDSTIKKRMTGDRLGAPYQVRDRVVMK